MARDTQDQKSVWHAVVFVGMLGAALIRKTGSLQGWPSRWPSRALAMAPIQHADEDDGMPHQSPILCMKTHRELTPAGQGRK